VRRGVALTRRRAPFAPQTGADKMMISEKSLEVFMGNADVTHVMSPGVPL
jgi:hypothetical protein